MISHIFIGVGNGPGDFTRACAFYSALMPLLGLERKFVDEAKPWAAWVAPQAPRPLLLIGHPFDGAPHAPGNGQMTALLAASRAAVDRVHAAALALGGQCEGAPGLRPEYHDAYYGAYFRDLDGNKLCVCCHDAHANDAV